MRIKVNIPEGVSGDFYIKHIETDYFCEQEPFDTYTILYHKNEHIMQDTTREYREHEQFLEEASGDVIVAGLGLGLVNQSLMDNPNVTSVTIIEKYQEVIDLVWNSCPKNGKMRLIHSDIYDWKPDCMFDIGWFDSWCGENTHKEYKKKMNELYSSHVHDIRFWKSFGNEQGWGCDSEAKE